MNRRFRKSTELLGAICGGLLIGLPAIPQVALAQQRPISPTSKVNPCPTIYYEQPHNNRVLVPQGCPPNAFTLRMSAQGQIQVPTVPVSPTQEQIRMGVGGETPTAAGSVLNPCPRIYYEEPFNNKNIVPQGCPPNALTQKLQSQGLTPRSIYPAEAPTTPAQIVPTPGQPGVAVQGVQPGNPPGTPTTLPVQPPLPETRQAPIATVMPTNGRVHVKLKNNTNAVVSYEAIGHTQRRFLAGRQEVVLQDLPLPLTLTAVRQDGGLLKFTPITSESGLLEFTLDEEKTLDQNQGAIRIQENGNVYLN